MSGATPEMDAIFKKAVVLLHSSAPNSATEMRLLVDELIKQRFGAEKMIVNKVSKKTLEALESNFPGRVTTPPPEAAPKEPPEIIDITDESRGLKSDEVFDVDSMPERDPEVMGFATGDTVVASGSAGGPITVADDDDPMAGNVDVDDGNLKDFGDLNCCVCGEMMFTATNRLVECSKCGTLYHQECHKPAISNEEASEDQQHNWQCEPCLSKPSTSKAAGIIVVPAEEPPTTQLAAKPKISATSSRSSSSSNPSSPFFGKAAEPLASTTPASVLPMAPPSPTNVLPTATSAVPPPVTSSSSSRHHHKGSSSSSKSKEERSTSGSRSGSGSEKAHSSSSSSSSTRKSSSHSSSSKKSSSRHHDSSSKRKSK